jgi:hypothetical protein
MEINRIIKALKRLSPDDLDRLQAELIDEQHRRDAAEMIGDEYMIVEMPNVLRRGHSRQVELEDYSYICDRCNRFVTYKKYPGNNAQSVCDSCLIDMGIDPHERRSSTARQKLYRERRKQRKAGAGDYVDGEVVPNTPLLPEPAKALPEPSD